MPLKPLDRAELEKITYRTVARLQNSGDCAPNYHGIAHITILDALTDIAKRALEWAAMTDQAFHPASFDRYVSESPRVLLSNALAALDAPETETEYRRTIPLTDAELLRKVPAFITTVTGKKLTEKQLYFLMEQLRWA